MHYDDLPPEPRERSTDTLGGAMGRTFMGLLFVAVFCALGLAIAYLVHWL
jgi:hypothetical protein